MALLSPRLARIVESLPLTTSSRVLEVGCGPGAAARAVAGRLVDGQVVAIDRSATAVAAARRAGAELIAAGLLDVRHAAIEDFVREPGEAPFDVVFAVRVGALDGRDPAAGSAAWARIAAALVPGGQVLIDGRPTPLPPGGPADHG
ncbi:methyltransferase domain-containing protein [Pseudonocardia saturnea]